MPSYNVTATSTATLLHTVGFNTEQVTIQNLGANTVFVSSNSGVTATTGFPLTTGSRIDWLNARSGSIYGITTSGTSSMVVSANVS